jgi:ketosteroid isomerase-like protein
VAKKRPAKKRPAKKRPVAKKGRAKRGKARAKGAPKKTAAASLEALARKIVRITESGQFEEAILRALYSEDCTSEEGTGQVDRGHAGLAQKNERWAQMQSGGQWKARNVWVGRDTICVEWDATVNMRDGRTVNLREVAVHEIRDGKIHGERYHYNPLVLAPPQG